MSLAVTHPTRERLDLTSGAPSSFRAKDNLVDGKCPIEKKAGREVENNGGEGKGGSGSEKE